MIDIVAGEPRHMLSYTLGKVLRRFADEFSYQELLDARYWQPYLYDSRAALAYDQEQCVGFLFWSDIKLTHTEQKAWCEDVLYVVPEYRGKGASRGMIQLWERRARLHRVTKLYAGSSLGHNDAASRVYSDAGFSERLSFQKEIGHV